MLGFHRNRIREDGKDCGWVRAIIVLTVLALGGCTTPYAPPSGAPEVDPPTSPPFPGIGDLIPPNTTAASPNRLHVYWVHGMCTHDFDWVQSRANLIAAALGISPVVATNRAPLGDDGAYTVDVPFQTERGAFVVTFVVWSPLTEKYHQALKFDASPGEKPPADPKGQFVYKRAGLNRDLKAGLMNDCLVDAVIYLGKHGDPIRAAMDQLACMALGGDYMGSQCHAARNQETGSAIFVAESLGSKFLFDAVRRVWNRAPESERLAFQTRLRSLRALYMVANQVPLLDQADELRPFGSSLHAFLDIVAPGRSDKLPVIAFTDPNDLLSYRLVPESLGLENATLVNVIVSNDDTYVGYVERPDTAHCGYAWNPYVIGTIAKGYHGTLNTAPVLAGSKSCFSQEKEEVS